MKAKLNGAKLIHVDPRFTRTSAACDMHVQIRAGSDIAFLGGLINHVIHSERWNSDPFFRDYVVNYTNAATLIDPEFRDTEDLNGVFSGLMEYTGGVENWPYNGFIGQYESRSWQYDRPGANRGGQNEEGRAAAAPGWAYRDDPPGLHLLRRGEPPATAGSGRVRSWRPIRAIRPEPPRHRPGPAATPAGLPPCRSWRHRDHQVHPERARVRSAARTG